MSKTAVPVRARWFAKRAPFFVLAVVACLFVGGLGAKSAVAAPAAARAPEVSVLTFGRGDQAFAKFGHNAVLVKSGRSTQVYNFGTFSFDSPLIAVDFLTGRFRYWLSVSTLPRTLAKYQGLNRTVVAQRLDLSPEQARDVADRLAENALDANKYYLYDYYRDNCSTRVRDLIDVVTEGRLRAGASGAAALTWREHTRRLTEDDLWLFLGLDVAMGPLIDRSRPAWDALFLPEMLRRSIEATRLEDGRPLVKQETVLFRADRADPPEVPSDWRLRLLLAGLFGGLVLAGLARSWTRGGRALRAGLGVALGGLGAVLGLLGCVFLMLWMFTNHEVAHWNQNILVCAPWALALAGYAPGVARGDLVRVQRARWVAGSLFVASSLVLVARVLPRLAEQQNVPFVLFGLGLWGGAAIGLGYLERALRQSTTR